MKKVSLVPQNDRELANWGKRFATIPAGCYGITEADLALLQTVAVDFTTKVGTADIAKNASKQATAEKQASRRVFEGVIRPLARRMKCHPDYTKGVGVQFGIEGSTSNYDLNNAAPDLSAIDKTGGTVELRFTRHGSDGIDIYLQREQDVEWQLVGRAMTSPFQDIRPLLVPGKSEIRRYTAVYMQKNQSIGRYSNDVAILCTP
jgi:hypothetical protein